MDKNQYKSTKIIIVIFICLYLTLSSSKDSTEKIKTIKNQINTIVNIYIPLSNNIQNINERFKLQQELINKIDLEKSKAKNYSLDTHEVEIINYQSYIKNEQAKINKESNEIRKVLNNTIEIINLELQDNTHKSKKLLSIKELTREMITNHHNFKTEVNTFILLNENEREILKQIKQVNIHELKFINNIDNIKNQIKELNNTTLIKTKEDEILAIQSKQTSNIVFLLVGILIGVILSNDIKNLFNKTFNKILTDNPFLESVQSFLKTLGTTLKSRINKIKQKNNSKKGNKYNEKIRESKDF